MKKKLGKITVPKGSIIQAHELMTATALSWTRYDVEFLATRTTRTPDVRFMGKEWEIKSPKGSSARTIENNMRVALKQSRNLVVDLQRIQRPEASALREVKTQVAKVRGLSNVLVVTKSREVIFLK